MPVKIENVVLV